MLEQASRDNYIDKLNDYQRMLDISEIYHKWYMARDDYCNNLEKKSRIFTKKRVRVMRSLHLRETYIQEFKDEQREELRADKEEYIDHLFSHMDQLSDICDRYYVLLQNVRERMEVCIRNNCVASLKHSISQLQQS